MDSQRPILEAALAKNRIALSSVPTDILLNALLDMAEHGTDAMDAMDRAVLRLHDRVAWAGDASYGSREERRQNFCAAKLTSLPFHLALALAATEYALQQMDARSKYANWNRHFLRELFKGLTSDHYQFFRILPQVRDRDNLPEGSGVTWTRGILKTAAENIDGALPRLVPDPYEVRKHAILLVKEASRLAKETIADRLDEARKGFVAADAEDEKIYLRAIVSQRINPK